MATAPATVTEHAAQLHQRALSQCARSRFDLAERTLLRGLRLLEAPEQADQAEAQAVRVRVLMTLSTVETELHGRDAGLARFEEAEQLAAVSGNPALQFAVDSATALNLLRRGDHDGALERFASAERNIKSATTSEACILFLNRGNLMLQNLHLAAARRDLDRCIELADAEPDNEQLRAWQFMARHNLGYLEFLAGNLPLALRMMDSAAAMPVAVSHGISALDKARVLIEAGLSDAADQTLRDAEAEFRRGRLHHELAETELARAECAVLGGDLRSARTLAGSARTRFRRRSDDRWRRVAELALLSADLADGRPPGRLVGPAERLAREFGEQGLQLQARTAELIATTALTRLGQVEHAEQTLEQLPPLSASDPIAVRLQQRAAAAGVARAAGRPAVARRQVRTGLADLSRHQAKFGSLDLQTSSAIHGAELVRLDLELALADGKPRQIFDAIERGRAVSRRLTAVTPPTGESADLLSELRQQSEILKAIGDDPTMSTAAADIRHRIAALYDRLSAISWWSDGAGDIGKPASMQAVSDVAAVLDKTLVSYVNLHGGWSAVVLSGGSARWVRLPGDDRTIELSRRAQADLDVLAYGTLPIPLRSAATASLQRTLALLDELLIAPLELGDAALAIIPTGPTTTLPWTCLPSLRGRPVEVAPTATSWLAGARAEDVAGPLRVGALCGPGLSTAPAEVTEIGRLWGPRLPDGVRSELHAGRADLADALATDTVVHVAAHGSHVRQNPMFSSLELTDGPLYAYEIAGRRVAPHVVLSACELGQATTRPGDEALGLTRVLLHLGAQCVVAGVAQVADELAGQVMADYHSRLVAGDDSASALAAATATGDYAPFVCFGSSWRTLPGPT
ncbi:CHAT domain-containing protein [Microlunatus ginsengisoli]|uniref:CHAT domain-containing protein n=1 Tax=Microlunatus ginsengisoli TaxID=363863 RepID=A0ABP6ZHG0_9ACTN